MKLNVSWRSHWTGDAIPSFLLTILRLNGLCSLRKSFPRAKIKERILRRDQEHGQDSSIFSCPLGGAAAPQPFRDLRSPGVRFRARTSVQLHCHRTVLEWPACYADRDRPQSACAAGIHVLLCTPDLYCLFPEPGLHLNLWIYRCLQLAGGTVHGSAPRYPAIYPGIELFAWRDAGDGSILSAASTGG